MNRFLATAWIMLVLLLAGLTIPSILTTESTAKWALFWIVIGGGGLYALLRPRPRRE